MNISYDLEFDMDSFLSDLERRQSARKRVRLEELKKEVRRLKNERKSRGDRQD
jgi:polyhydroxyalkanoate synthesis regulator phasin